MEARSMKIVWKSWIRIFLWIRDFLFLNKTYYSCLNREMFSPLSFVNKIYNVKDISFQAALYSYCCSYQTFVIGHSSILTFGSGPSRFWLAVFGADTFGIAPHDPVWAALCDIKIVSPIVLKLRIWMNERAFITFFKTRSHCYKSCQQHLRLSTCIYNKASYRLDYIFFPQPLALPHVERTWPGPVF